MNLYEIASVLGKEFLVGHCVFIGNPSSEAVERIVFPYLRDIWLEARTETTHGRPV